MAALSILRNTRARQRTAAAPTSAFDMAAAASACRFHRTIPAYRPTPLHALSSLSRHLDLAQLWLKDESQRFDLNAFKGLGASYAVAHLLAARLGLDESELDFAQLTSAAAARALRDTVFASATGGNHGRGLAWTAQLLGCRCVVYLPAGAAASRVANLERHGAEVTVTDVDYDDSVRLITERARDNGWLVVQDTAWPGYEEIPRAIMQGYLTMFAEAFEQLQGQVPTHVLIQLGVGSLAASLQGYLVERFGADRPLVIAAEAAVAPKYHRSIAAGGEDPLVLTGSSETVLVTIACNEANPLAWPILRDHTDFFAACPDWVGTHGERVLSSPSGGDPRITGGATGAATIGLVAALCDPDVAPTPAADSVGLTPESRVLVFLTEGATDPVAFRKAVWYGGWPTPSA